MTSKSNRILKSGSTDSTILNEIYQQIKLAGPVSFTFLLRKSLDIVSVIFVGHLSERFLSGAGLATVTANVTGNSLMVGLSGALATLCSQANGARDFDALGLALQRGVLISLCLCIPISILWYFSYPVIVFLGQEPSIAYDARNYMCALMPGLWSYAISMCIQTWLHSQQHTRAVAVIAGIVAVLHPLWVYLLMNVYHMGYLGAAIAVSISRSTELLLLLTFLQISSIIHDTEFQWSKRALTGWPTFLRLAIPSLMMISEWWASETIIFMAGFLQNPALQVASMSIYQNINSLCFMVPAGLGVSASSRVGNAIGAGEVGCAQSAVLVAPAIALCLSACTACGLVVFRNSIGFIFTTDRDIVDILSSLLGILALYIMADSVQSALTGVVKGVGRQAVCGPIVIFSYYIVAIPCSAVLAFQWGFGLGATGLCIGTTIGTTVHMLLYIIVVARVDFVVEVELAQERLSSFKNDSTDKTSISNTNFNATDRGGMSVMKSGRNILNNVDDDWWDMGFEKFVSPRGNAIADLFGIGGRDPHREYELVQSYTDALDDTTNPGDMEEDPDSIR
eukprot:gene4592-9126_t